ncbi:ABC-type transport system permease protein (probable substrate phosphate) [Natrialba magadii ATCC 43099]|uniref:Phosphate transport system permease protein PstA n=1 Tax=Natrialba magadii (strain ATCC 43099 / DSM 3394 / CCM 3739 / CIP 104546 / IAM 13178 / JCM 8861 / NBRC 102185 / NCIMB 2190 / MS3) TaxID=547559 RepID=D3SXH3_NATMM|nr:phosphate ABC transporter permease PstA [Natrialba magadii]ADD05922.1 ABC-type transport system permease protein (probable substrate phosphate) [Natrialba magadii ATCC 43099]ELY30571.1 phosphate ABC transporter permease [Natrialba magadii ATCC 43099]
MSTKRETDFLEDVDLSREKLLNRVFYGTLVVASLFGLVMLLLLIADVVWESYQAFVTFDIDLGNYLTATSSSRAERAGFGASILASLWLMALTAVLAFFIAVGCAIYLVEYAPENRVTRLIEANLANLAGVPSIVYGLLVLALIVNDAGLGSVILAGAIALALLIVPIIIVASIESIRAVPSSVRDGSYAMGATKWQTIRQVVLPKAMPGILTGTILALARAIGETAPLIMVGTMLHATRYPSGPLSSFSAMPTQIYNWTYQADRMFNGLAALGIVVLLLFLVAMYALAGYLRKRYETDGGSISNV